MTQKLGVAIAKTLCRGDELLARVESSLAFVTGFAAVAMTGGILFDVASRIFTRQSEGWGYDLTAMFMFLLTYASAGYVARRDGHIRVDIVIEHFSPHVNRRLIILTTALSLLFAVLLLTQGWGAFLDVLASGKATQTVRIPHFWFAGAIPLGSFLLALELAVALVRHVVALARERHLVDAEGKLEVMLRSPAADGG